MATSYYTAVSKGNQPGMKMPTLRPGYVVGLAGILIGVGIALVAMPRMGLPILVSVCCLLLSLILLYKAVCGIRILAIPAFFFLFYLLEVYAGGTYWLLFREYNSDFLWAINLGMLLFALGVYMCTIIVRFNPRREFERFARKIPVDSLRGLRFDLVFSGLLLVSVAMGVFQILRVGELPWLALFTQRGDVMGNLAARQTFTGARGTEYLKQFYETILPFLTLIAVAKYYCHKTHKWRFLAIFLVCISLLTLVSSGQKAPAAIFLIQLLLLWQFYFARFNLKASIIVVTLGTSVVAAMTVLRWGISVSEAFYSIYNRVVVVPIQWNLFPIFDLFPRTYAFGYGRFLWGDVVSLRPGPDVSFPTWLYQVLFPSADTVGTANSIFTGQLYADFGLVGVLAGMFVAGLLMQALQIHFFRANKTVLRTALFAALNVRLVNLVNLPLVSVFISQGIVALLLATLVLRAGPALMKTRVWVR